MSSSPGPTVPAAAPWRRWQRVGASALLILATAVAYMPAWRAGFIWDDDAHVTRPELRSLEGLGRIWFELGATQQYYPLLHSAFWLEHRLWGDRPEPYHALNIALHAAAALLVFAVVRRLVRERAIAWADPAAFLAASVFALHPVHAESVAWITEQKNTLSAVFYLAAMLVYLRYEDSRRRALYGWATLLFILGVLTKTVTATLPAALLVIGWWRRARLSWRDDVVPLLPWFVLGATGGLFTAWVEHDLIGAKGQAFELSLIQRLLLGGKVVWFYTSKLFWPVDLIFIYPRWTIDPGAWRQWLFPVGAIVVALAALLLARRSRAPLAALLFFVGTLFPVLGLFNVYPFLFSFVADHFQYLASLGLIVPVCCAVVLAVWRIRSSHVRAAITTVVLIMVPALLGVLTYRQARMYADIDTLYLTTIEKNPACWMAHNNLGVVLRERGLVEQAIGHYRRALELRPEYPEAHNNLGVALASTGRHDDAIASYRQALHLRPANPEALANLATALASTGRHREAVESLGQALRLDPRNAALHANLGAALQAAGRPAEAVDSYQRSLALDPGRPEVRFGLAVGLSQSGRPDQAIEQYRQVLQRQPEHVEAHNNLAALLARAGRVAEAIPHFEHAARLRPTQVEMHMNLAVAYSSAARFSDALAAAERARQLALSSGQPGLVEKIESWIASCRQRAAERGPG